MKVKDPIITSLLDNDLYTITVGQVAFQKFPDATVEYSFINRNNTKFTEHFLAELKHQFSLMKQLKLTSYELVWLKSLDYFTDDYLAWLNKYQFNPNELIIKLVDGVLTITVKGSWMRTIMWEVPILALVSELYFKLESKQKMDGWIDRIARKAQNLSSNGCLWIDFGTRRRFDFEVQQEVVRSMKSYTGFLGTSNMMLAQQYEIQPVGTMSHQGPMAMMAKYGVKNANKQWMSHWIECYKDKLLTYLPDTFTTGVFLRDFDKESAKVWNLRQDSGVPSEWMDTVLAHYEKLGVSTKNKKTFVFSDGLTDETYKNLSLKYRKYATIVGGIGTSISNDCGHTPLNIVVKLTRANFGQGWVDVVKLSDSKGKYTGNPEAVKLVKLELGII
jgi:nicotinate phosphoribosyltransferase